MKNRHLLDDLVEDMTRVRLDLGDQKVVGTFVGFDTIDLSDGKRYVMRVQTKRMEEKIQTRYIEKVEVIR
jgi:hypothetical protein